jgi:hypothetical protein
VNHPIHRTGVLTGVDTLPKGQLFRAANLEYGELTTFLRTRVSKGLLERQASWGGTIKEPL